jgi:hypothetical protein
MVSKKKKNLSLTLSISYPFKWIVEQCHAVRLGNGRFEWHKQIDVIFKFIIR